MTAFNPLTTILTQNKLEGPNYVDWKRNLDIVLIAEEYKFMLDEHQHQSLESAYDILENLKEMFGDQNRAAKQTAMKALLNTKMVEGSSTLPDSFQQFRLNYNMNKMNLSLAKLLYELQPAETIIKQQAPPMALNFEGGSASKPRGSQKKKKT
ncbi:PREDICTED: uncharacterized protein LOC109230302 [Nicotiana attenuata]|uniref:uncharacterized protein LOC109230302 n=1 Tax=Nicotiana attenuata TaxID=49451 RepID=UPI0009052F84|nr:PREDICTED: uncharacterized protein LOC109230302 [Nicotiana attenuata]